MRRSDPRQARLEGLAPPRSWPDVHRVPHNEAALKVKAVLGEDLDRANQALLLSPVTDLSPLLELVGRWTDSRGTLRLLLGRRPGEQRGATFEPRLVADEEAVRADCMDLGLSVLDLRHVIQAKTLIDAGRLEARIYRSNHRAFNARVLVTDQAALLGSTAVTARALTEDVEANVRALQDEPGHYPEISKLAEGLWQDARPWTAGLRALLDALIRPCTWQEAVGRAAALLLEGDWMRERLRLPTSPPLWPHQEVAISRGLYLLDNAGGLLVADATGSGKTRLGAWLVSAAWSRRMRKDGDNTRSAVVIVPPGVTRSWQAYLGETQCARQVHSRGDLSASRSSQHQSILEQIDRSMLLAVDEAHNFVNPSMRTRAVLRHLADEAILFTATPISRGAQDLLSMIALLGVDNLDDAHVQIIEEHMRQGRRAAMDERTLEVLKAALQSFMLRRTRADIAAYTRRYPDRYRARDGRIQCYPTHEARSYDLPLSDADAALVVEIRAEVDELRGLCWLGDELRPRLLQVDEQKALQAILSSARGLARYHVLAALRSSRAALLEHIHGTAWAAAEVDLDPQEVPKTETAGLANRLDSLELPALRFPGLLQDQIPPWLGDADAYRRARDEERQRYERIAALTRQLSEDREVRKARQLVTLHGEHRGVLAFDRHLISLKLLERRLQAEGVTTLLLTGRGGGASKARAERSFGLSGQGRCVGLCTDAFSEGLNLQGASCVVHLDVPTVIRAAVQRAGRVDRLDSPHPSVQIYWPDEPAPLQLSKAEKLIGRVKEERRIINSDVLLPDELDPVSTRELQIEAEAALQDADNLPDAFSHVEALVSGEAPLVPEDVYRSVCGQERKIRCMLSLLPIDHRSWAFFVLDGVAGAAPRWVLFPGETEAPVTDLAKICAWFRENLGPEIAPDAGPQALATLERYTHRLAASARGLLSRRRQRALELLDGVIERELQRRAGFEGHERDELRVLQVALGPSRERPLVDLAQLADRWLDWLRPLWRELVARKGRRYLPRLKDLTGVLVERGPTLKELQGLFTDLPLAPPLDRQVLVALVASNTDD